MDNYLRPKTNDGLPPIAEDGAGERRPSTSSRRSSGAEGTTRRRRSKAAQKKVSLRASAQMVKIFVARERLRDAQRMRQDKKDKKDKRSRASEVAKILAKQDMLKEKEKGSAFRTLPPVKPAAVSPRDLWAPAPELKLKEKRDPKNMYCDLMRLTAPSVKEVEDKKNEVKKPEMKLTDIVQSKGDDLESIKDTRLGDRLAELGSLYTILSRTRNAEEMYFTYRAMDAAARNGHYDVVKWLHENRTEGCSAAAMDGAAANGYLHVVKFLHDNRKEGCTRNAMDSAAENGFTDVVMWLHDNRKEGCTMNALQGALKNKHWHIASFLKENRKEFRRLHKKMVKNLEGSKKRNGEDADEDDDEGHLAGVLTHCNKIWVDGDRYAEDGLLSIIEKNYPILDFTPNAMNKAASRGHLEVVRWLHKNTKYGCTKVAMNRAAANGHLDVVKWLHEKRKEGCSHAAMDEAAGKGYFSIVVWLHENRPEGCSKRAMDLAATNGYLDIVKWLSQNRKEGCSQRAMDGAAANGHQKIVMWLHVNRKEGCSTYAMNKAAERGHFDVVKFLYENRREGCTKSAVNFAALAGKRLIVQWLILMELQHGNDHAIEWANWNDEPGMRDWLLSNVPQNVAAVQMGTEICYQALNMAMKAACDHVNQKIDIFSKRDVESRKTGGGFRAVLDMIVRERRAVDENDLMEMDGREVSTQNDPGPLDEYDDGIGIDSPQLKENVSNGTGSDTLVDAVNVLADAVKPPEDIFSQDLDVSAIGSQGEVTYELLEYDAGNLEGDLASPDDLTIPPADLGLVLVHSTDLSAEDDIDPTFVPSTPEGDIGTLNAVSAILPPTPEDEPGEMESEAPVVARRPTVHFADEEMTEEAVSYLTPREVLDDNERMLTSVNENQAEEYEYPVDLDDGDNVDDNDDGMGPIGFMDLFDTSEMVVEDREEEIEKARQKRRSERVNYTNLLRAYEQSVEDEEWHKEQENRRKQSGIDIEARRQSTALNNMNMIADSVPDEGLQVKLLDRFVNTTLRTRVQSYAQKKFTVTNTRDATKLQKLREKTVKASGKEDPLYIAMLPNLAEKLKKIKPNGKLKRRPLEKQEPIEMTEKMMTALKPRKLVGALVPITNTERLLGVRPSRTAEGRPRRPEDFLKGKIQAEQKKSQDWFTRVDHRSAESLQKINEIEMNSKSVWDYARMSEETIERGYTIHKDKLFFEDHGDDTEDDDGIPKAYITAADANKHIDEKRAK